MGGKYEIRYWLNKGETEVETLYMNSWLEFMKIKLTKKVIYYKVYLN